jgi:phage shock protein PspC (stress-responsive transcriptional regulator)
MKQKLDFDLTTKIISALVIAIPFVMMISQYFIINGDNVILTLTSFFLFITYLVAWLLHPTSYEITNENLLIHRPLHAIKISLASIKNIERAEPGYSMRIFGSGGLPQFDLPM